MLGGLQVEGATADPSTWLRFTYDKAFSELIHYAEACRDVLARGVGVASAARRSMVKTVMSSD